MTRPDKDLFESYHAEMIRRQKVGWFGREIRREPGQVKAPAIHINSRSNPRPWTQIGRRSGRRYRVAAKITPAMEKQHLRGERALFHLSRGDRRLALYAIDIDAEPNVEQDEVEAFARRVAKRLLPGVEVFIEPSRSYPHKSGAYIWFHVRYRRVEPEARRRLENAFNRMLEQLELNAPVGIKVDALKGATTYTYDNPRFDHAFAADFAGDVRRCDELYDPELKEWLALRAAERLYSVEYCERLKCRTRWEDIDREEAYERCKAFYGLWDDQMQYGVLFLVDPRLERIWRHYGTLVTRPCFGALSGRRPNNLAEFVDWCERDAGQITERQFRRLIPDKPKPVASGKAESKASRKFTSQLPVPAHLPRPDHSVDWLILFDGEDKLERYNAAARIALRHTNGDAPDALALGLALVELECGPATGPRTAERERRMAGCVDFALTDFNPTGGQGPRARPFDDADIKAMARMLEPMVDLERSASCRRITLDKLALAACTILGNIYRGEFGEVPVSSIAGSFKAHGCSVPNGVISQMVDLLVIAGVIRRVSNHCTAVRRSRAYALGPNLDVPAWLEIVMRRRAQLAATA